MPVEATAKTKRPSCPRSRATTAAQAASSSRRAAAGEADRLSKARFGVEGGFILGLWVMAVAINMSVSPLILAQDRAERHLAALRFVSPNSFSGLEGLLGAARRATIGEIR